MSDNPPELKENDFAKGRSRFRRYQHTLVELPSRLRLAAPVAYKQMTRPTKREGLI